LKVGDRIDAEMEHLGILHLESSSDAESFDRGSNAELKPHKLEGTMAFIFEMRFLRRVTAYAKPPKHFDPNRPRGRVDARQDT
jgi:homogentisate 1,2-dioxygenase